MFVVLNFFDSEWMRLKILCAKFRILHAISTTKLITQNYLGLNLGGSAAGGTALGDLGLAGSLLLSQTLLDEDSVGGGIGLGLLQGGNLGLGTLVLAVQGDRGDQTLDLGAFCDGDGLLALLLLESAGDDILADVVSLGQAEELADLVGTLGAESLGDSDVGEALDLAVALLHDNQAEGGQIRANDAAAHGFPLADGRTFADTARGGAVARGALGQQEADAGVGKDTLSHGETILVGTTGDLEDL